MNADRAAVIVATAIEDGITAWKRNDETAMQTAISKAVARLSRTPTTPERSDDE